ncbi:MAG: 23S rRNA (guanosine(2251)-2'-O)-methyltransferase RlmB [Sandaracinaceae bacterium]|jgi:23S rRNA (guanosine2251-2'-O)-methyltransferase|nr:23S rRNA (guanosine(2251)-2'-O)-methyltransferase RlmB [Sandaracinaceae bacterium]
MKRIVVGRRAVVEAIRANGKDVAAVFVDEHDAGALREIEEEARRAGLTVVLKSTAELDELADGLRHQGAIAIGGEFSYVDMETLRRRSKEPPLFVALDEITDPHNFGAIIRSAVAFGADGIITLKHRAAPVTPVVVRASTGATEHASIARVTNLVSTLKELAEEGFDIVGLDAEGTTSMDEIGTAELGTVLVIGSEGKGLRRLVREHCTRLARIEMDGPIASLNASVAAGIAIHYAARGRARIAKP